MEVCSKHTNLRGGCLCMWDSLPKAGLRHLSLRMHVCDVRYRYGWPLLFAMCGRMGFWALGPSWKGGWEV